MSARDLQIKARSVGNLTSEYAGYVNELEEHKNRISTLENQKKQLDPVSNKDEIEELEYRIKKQHEIVDETAKMIPISQKQLRQVYEELKNLVKQYSDNTSVNGTKDFVKAQDALSAAEKKLQELA